MDSLELVCKRIRDVQSIIDKYNIKAEVVDEIESSRINSYIVNLIDDTKISDIKRIRKEMAVGLGVDKVNVVPFPERKAFSIQVPNQKDGIVRFSDIVKSPEFKSSKSRLTFILGQDISGNIILADLNKMPHLLVSGTTGSGKSVFSENLIMSLMFKNTPLELELVLIDLKKVGFPKYNKLPHCISPVITEAKKAVDVLNWIVRYMDARYRFLAQKGCKDIAAYNSNPNRCGYLRPVVIIIEELSDLMMASNKKVEEPIARLAQMSRACGIYLTIATQRPDKDVLTGLIKANIPSKTAFRTSNAINSRIIIDESGAEKLLGKGDMLFFPDGSTCPIRIQGAYITDDEIEKVLKFIYDQNHKSNCREEIINILSSNFNSKPSMLESVFQNCINGNEAKLLFDKINKNIA